MRPPPAHGGPGVCGRFGRFHAPSIRVSWGASLAMAAVPLSPRGGDQRDAELLAAALRTPDGEAAVAAFREAWAGAGLPPREVDAELLNLNVSGFGGLHAGLAA
uniref:Uncharacterized protein n=1 Tax=Alexandrium monilatum TaxID=311494 RepID=A0A7S4QIX8_9DINO